jgi:hypothetical protein
MTNYEVKSGDLFSGVDGPGQPVGADGYVVGNTNLFTYYTNQGANYQSNLSGFDYIYQGTPFDIMLYNYFSKASIGTPGNATFNNINGRLCWIITGSTTVTFNFPNTTTINFVAVGGGQRGGQGSNNGSGGNGGGVVTGIISGSSSNNQLTITIGSSGTNTIISGTAISITANAGSSSVPRGTISGSDVGGGTISPGGIGGNIVQGTGYYTYFKYAENGKNGPFINNLGIYVAGGGGSGSPNNGDMFGYNVSGSGGAAGGGRGAGQYSITGPFNIATPGSLNTGGGGGGNSMSIYQQPDSDGALGGSGVVYLYL